MHAVYVETVSRIVTHNGGVVHDFEADLIKCSFGASKRCFEPEKRAVQAAVRIQQQLREEAEILKFPSNKDIRVRIGITMGKARCGNLGSGRMKRWTNVGPHFRAASALLQVAREESIPIALSGTVAKACKVHFVCQVVDVVALPPRRFKTIVYTPVEEKHLPADEWMYQLEESTQIEESSVSFQINSAWKHFCNGHPDRCVNMLEKLKRDSRMEEGQTPSETGQQNSTTQPVKVQVEKLKSLVDEFGSGGGQ